MRLEEKDFKVLADNSWLRIYWLSREYSSWGYRKLGWYYYKNRAGKNIRLVSLGQLRMTLGRLRAS